MLNKKKICTKCDVNKNAMDFYDNAASATGLTSWCKRCICAHKQDQRDGKIPIKKIQRSNNLVISMGSHVAKICNRCQAEKTLSEFYQDPQGKGGFSSWCIQCQCSRGKIKRAAASAAKKQWRLDHPIVSRICTGCGIEKDLSEFYLYTTRYSKKAICSVCKKCQSEKSISWKNKNQDRQKITGKAWRVNNPEKTRGYRDNHKWKHLKNADGSQFKSHDYSVLFSQQDHKCKICKSGTGGKNGWALDHDHKTGIVRGILCNPCNMGLGHFKDTPSFLHSAADYLDSHKKKTEAIPTLKLVVKDA